MMDVSLSLRLGLLCCALAVGLTACETNLTGTADANLPPETVLSVRDTSLVDNLAGADRFSSTVSAAWSGTDPDGYVERYELRYYSEDEAPADPEEGWRSTTRLDSLVLLPIPRGERAADVVFEVRAVDNEGLKDPTPARTVFPIQNAPPSIRFSLFDQPPDTTFSIVSFAWDAEDPEGPDNLARIDIALNDSLNFTALPPDLDFVTLVAQDPAAEVTSARVFAGRGFQSTTLEVPGLRPGAENTLYLRAVDQTDTTSVLQRFTWFVKRTNGEVLYVNDYRKSTAPTLQAYHLGLLRDYLPTDVSVDIWDISTPYATGTAGSAPRSDQLPPNADPTLRRQLALYD